ncbi:bifunctional SAM-dependent methyltransferase RsmB-NOP2-type/RNA (C5-cytosine) methyltransferase/S-adenosyl-L-methionine-dependent methyltransferase superfamily [Babesia duncani]|uniref:Bifunctional SAM-dependent methyltransferase RsmB-NOP2-type/RNA (C5-cytosine) methyltransferase/S-adenosyl-L-methionine-dependent methyltransferase superfamily n=1 Tax=Babesia duncani TaxID=323732 RepID=A0AAD9UPK1_9APIC|nr:bifunctional SAM-dependent methyltransferase RsmB-NOP2-type/RNA (C5-cytosine) methyltransferase/S-adenosyl-L-methionine-dependent methyltransferase superfamily [Babesia duncani]
MSSNDAIVTTRQKLGWRSRCLENRRRGVPKDSSRPKGVDSVRFTEKCENLAFEKYYKAQHLVPLEEWESFMECNRRRLPISFRMNTSTILWSETLAILKEASQTCAETALSPCLSHVPEYLEKDECIYYCMQANKSDLKNTNPYKHFRDILISEDSRGSLTRQEVTSMIPVLFLNPQPHENILDACAAPGMKFLQIIDTVTSRAMASKGGVADFSKLGMIIGNDSCQLRLSTLGHHVKSLGYPNIAITNFDASLFPQLYTDDGKRLMFDKILADVPCTCDGTLRKSLDIWKNWTPMWGVGMHRLQLSILKRCLELLKPGGLLIYSTCSLNPLENEAIANYIVSQGQTENIFLEQLPKLEGIRMRPGLTTWRVPNPDGGFIDTFTQEQSSRLVPTMFPTETWTPAEAAKVARILPHDSDTGGFFICAIRKLLKAEHDSKDCPEHQKVVNVQEHETSTKASDKDIAKRKRGAKLLHHHDLWSRVASRQELEATANFYGIDPDWFAKHLVIKRDSGQSLHLVGESLARPLLRRVKQVGNESNNGWAACKYALLGVRCFTPCESRATCNTPCKWRPCHEGVRYLVPVAKKRVIRARYEFLKDALSATIPATTLDQKERDGILNLDSCRDETGQLVCGGCILILEIPKGKILDHCVPGEFTGDCRKLKGSIGMACVLSNGNCLFQCTPPQVLECYGRALGPRA